MFEKLKEYWLYIILWLAALWALSYMYITTQNTNKWADLKKEIQYKFLDWIKLKDEAWYRNKTITWLINDVNWKTFNWKVIDWDSVYLINQDWLLAVEDWRLAKLLTPQQVNKLYYSWNPAELKLFLIPLVNSNLVDTNNLNWILELREDEINEINTNWWLKNILENLNWNWSQSSWNKNIKDLSDFSRWYIWEWYFWLWLFDSQQDAIDFAHDYFNGAEVVQVSDNWKYWVFFEIVGWWSTANYNIDTLRCDWVTRETQNQLDNKTNQVNELLARELDYINTINEKNQALIDKEQEKNTAVNQCLQQKQEALEAKDTEKTEAINTCNTEKNEAIAAKEAEKTAAVNQCNTEKTQIQTQLTQKTNELNALNTLNSWATWNAIMNWSNFYQWSINQDWSEMYSTWSVNNRFWYTIWDDYYFWFFKTYVCQRRCSDSWKKSDWLWVITFKLTPNWQVSAVQWPTLFRWTQWKRREFKYEYYKVWNDLYMFVTTNYETDWWEYRRDWAHWRNRVHYPSYHVLKLTISWFVSVEKLDDTSINCWKTQYNLDDRERKNQIRNNIETCLNNKFQEIRDKYWFNDSTKISSLQIPYTKTNKVHSISQYAIWWCWSRWTCNLVFTWK